jgi:hypothetical protein
MAASIIRNGVISTMSGRSRSCLSVYWSIPLGPRFRDDDENAYQISDRSRALDLSAACGA